MHQYSDISDDEFENFQCSGRKSSDGDACGNESETSSVGCGVSRIIGANLGHVSAVNRRLGLSKTVSRKRSYNVVSDQKIEELKQIKMPKKSESKMNWGVRAYNEWRDYKLEKFDYDYGIYNADLRNLESLTEENLEYSMCQFIPEVTKQKGTGPYPGKTLYQMVVAIQKFLNMNRLMWKLVDLKSDEFLELRTVLDNVMKERTKMGVGTVKKQVQYISYEYEEELWEKNILGEQEPDQLRNTVLFLLGINLALRGVDEHYLLHRDTPDRDSQLSFQRNSKGTRCLVYTEDTCTKVNDGGLNHMRRERKIVWVYPSENVERCPVRLVDKYISLCPPYYKKPNFYLQSKLHVNPCQWYTGKVVGSNSLAKVVKSLLSDAKIDGYFTNHSLRRSCPTRLFQAGIEKKMIKEVTGHRSDALDMYEVTSEEQKKKISEVLACKPITNKIDEPSKNQDKSEEDESKNITKLVNPTSSSVEQIGKVIQNVVSSKKENEKVVIRLEIEISNK